MPARKLVPLVTDVTIKMENSHESSPAPSDISSCSSVTGKRKATYQLCPDMDREKKRKLMNRVAAQQSRDRKREHMELLERELKRLKSENEQLKTDKQLIQREKEQLQQENEKIKNQVAYRSTSENETPLTFEPAEFISALLPQGQVDKTHFLQTLLLFLAQLLVMRNHQSQIQTLATFSPLSKNCAETLSQDNLRRLQQTLSRCALKYLRTKHWGPHQNAWNPCKSSCCSPISITSLS